MNNRSFLQRHYDRYRKAGGDHAEYISDNEIENQVIARELRENYEALEAKLENGEKTE